MKKSQGIPAHRLGTQVAHLVAQVGEQAMNADQVDRSQISASHTSVAALFAQTAIKSALSRLVAGASLALALTLLSACQPPSSSQGPQRGSELQPSSPSSSPQGPSSGTGDTGGGTGFRNNFYEAYTVVIEDTPAYQKFVEPVLLHADTLEKNEDESKPSELTSLLRFMIESVTRSKKWYIIPAELKEIAKEVHGLEGVNVDPTRYGLQTDTEVILTKSFWEHPGTGALSSTHCRNRATNSEMTPEDCADYSRASAIWHEIMLGLYMLKYEEFSKLCELDLFRGRVTSKESFQACIGASQYLLNRAQLHNVTIDLKPAQPTRVWADLVNADYLSVRQAAAYFMNRGRAPNHSSVFRNILGSLGFDKRIFGIEMAQLLFSRPNVMGKMILDQVVRSVVLSGRNNSLPQVYRTAKSSEWGTLKRVPCQLFYSETPNSENPSQLPPKIELTLKIQDQSVSGLDHPRVIRIPIENNSARAQFKDKDVSDESGRANEASWSVVESLALGFGADQSPSTVRIGTELWRVSIAVFQTGVRAVHLSKVLATSASSSQDPKNSAEMIQLLKVAGPPVDHKQDIFIELNSKASFSKFVASEYYHTDQPFEFPLN